MSTITQSFNDFKDFKEKLNQDVVLQNEFKSDPVNAVNKLDQRPLDSDLWIYRMVVISLGVCSMSVVIGVIILIAMGEITDQKHVPDILTALGSAAIGALAGLLAPSPRANG